MVADAAPAAAGGCASGGCSSGGGCASGSAPRPAAPPAPAGADALCRRCRAAPADALLHAAHPVCLPCLHAAVAQRVRTAARGRGPLRAGDLVAVGYAGDAASVAAAALLAGVRTAGGEGGGRGRSGEERAAYRLVLLHVDERAAAGPSSDADAALVDAFEADADADAAAVAAAAAQHAGAPLIALRLEDAYSELESGGARRAALRALLAAAGDATGRADLARALRLRVLVAAAAAAGAPHLALATTATAAASAAVAAAAKGRGYALPADAGAADARRGARAPSLLRPLRGVSDADAAAALRHLGLEPAPPQRATAPPPGDVDALSARFVAAVQAANPGGVGNILAALSRLEPFAFTEVPARGGGPPPSGPAGEALCPLCAAPLADDEVAALAAKSGGADASLCARLCDACVGAFAEGAAPAELLPADVRAGMAALGTAAGAAAAALGAAAPPAELRAAIAARLAERDAGAAAPA
jgi:hypothetical protein